MAEVSYWEKAFVERFIIKEKRDRYLMFLKGGKHRKKVLERLNHNLDFERSKAEDISKKCKSTKDILTFLKLRYVDDTCYVMAFQNDLDGSDVRLALGVQELFESPWGIILICPPKPIAIYKEEEIGCLYLLKD